MSKKKFDPEKFSLLEFLKDFFDSQKAEEFAETEFNSRFNEDTQMFIKNAQNSSIYQALTLQDKYLTEEKGHNLIVFVRYFSIHVPEWKVYPVFLQCLINYYNSFPRNSIQKLFSSEQKGISEKKYDSPEKKYLKNVAYIDFRGIKSFLENYIFLTSLHKALNKESPQWFDDFKVNILDIEKEIQFYFASCDHDPSKLEALFLKLYKFKPPRRISQEPIEQTPELFNQVYHFFKTKAFKDSFTQNDFERSLKSILAIISEIKKLGISTEVFQNLLDYIHTVNNSKEPKYLFLHKLFQILFPSQFTSVVEWEAIKKTSAINKNGFYVQEVKDTFKHEVKKFLCLY